MKVQALNNAGWMAVCVGLGFMGSPLAAAAAETAAPNGAASVPENAAAAVAPLAIEPADLDTITVYATRNPITAFDYAGQVSVLDREAILDFNPSTISDVFAAIPGAQFDSGPRRTGDAPGIRGLSGQGVLIFLDGARQSFVSGHDGRFFVDPDLVQAVEVVRGPTSALYGSGALGGVIATRTITAADILQEGERAALRLTTGYQSVNDEFRAGGTGVWQSDDGLVDVVGHLTYRDSGNIDLGNDTTLPADDEILSSLLKLTVRPSDEVEIYASWIRYGADATDPQNPQGANLAAPGNPLVFRDVEANTFQGGVNWDPDSPLVNFNLVGYLSESGVEEDEVENPRTTDREVETFGFLIDNRSRFALSSKASLTLTYGGEYYQDRQTGLDTATADGSRGGVPDAETDFFGAFIQAELTLEDAILPGTLSIIPGVRWDRFDSSADGEVFEIEESEISPKVGVTYKPVPQFLLFGNYAQGFRAPSFNEAFADGVHFSIPDFSAPPGPFGPAFVQNLFIGNPDLTAEDSTTWEVGAGIDFEDIIFGNDRLIAKGSYYKSNVDNLIGLDVETPLGCFDPMLSMFAPCGTGPEFGNTSQNINIANAEIDGIELEFSYDADLFYLRGNYATIDGIDADSGEFLEGVLQPDLFFVDAGVRVDPLDLRLGSRVRVGGEFTAVNNPVEVRESYVVGDVYAVWEPRALEGVRLDLGVDNITDTDYEVVFAGVSQSGRNFKATLSWQTGF